MSLTSTYTGTEVNLTSVDCVVTVVVGEHFGLAGNSFVQVLLPCKQTQ